MELAEIVPTVLACGNGQSAVHDILGKGWWLTEPKKYNTSFS